jgi:hypothetical protein
MLNIAAQAPMPSPSVARATNAKPGDFRSWRRANFKDAGITDLRLYLPLRRGGWVVGCLEELRRLAQRARIAWFALAPEPACAPPPLELAVAGGVARR